MKKVAILGDIHANLAALRAVLNGVDEAGCDTILSTGDIVGYGPSPVECLEIIHEREIQAVLGNHDHYVTLLMDPRLEKLAPGVRESIEWTQQLLEMDELKWLANLPRKLEFEAFGLVHGSYGPNPWRYLTNTKNLARNFKHQEVSLAFCGHSHIPILSYPMGEKEPHLEYLRSCRLPEDREKIMVNVGSVGQPRDHDPRAACVMYDVEDRQLQLMRVEYDIAETQSLMRKAGLPEKFISRLEVGR